jgi:hypothetical protein
MSDDAERRNRPQFEPPPWERERFEELARKREAAEKAATPAPEEASGELLVEPEPASPVSPAREPEGAKAAPTLDERKVKAMLVQLSGEEGPATRTVAQAGKVTAMILVAIGVGMMVFGAVLASRSAAVEGRIGAGVIAILGAFVAGFAGWMWVRANNEQGS